MGRMAGMSLRCLNSREGSVVSITAKPKAAGLDSGVADAFEYRIVPPNSALFVGQRAFRWWALRREIFKNRQAVMELFPENDH